MIEWLEKAELVCALRGITRLEAVLPLRLTGGAFAVYQQLTAEDKADSGKIKFALKTAFAVDAFTAYELFVARRLQPGETVDVYLAELRRLAVPFGGLPEKALVSAFVAGLPDGAKQLLRAGSPMDDLPLTHILARARAILKDESGVAAVATPAGAASGTVCGVAAVLHIDEPDFTVQYDETEKAWTVTWKWTNDAEPVALRNNVAEYSIPPSARASYEAEVDEWIRKGWLKPYDAKKMGPAKGLIPLMAIVQVNKDTVRPVMDFRELNSHVDAFTAGADVCADKLREWRRLGTNMSIVDLRRAYLQLHVHESLWPFQTVVYHGQRYCLTRLGFGLNVAPIVMKAVLTTVLKQDETVGRATSAYLDDIMVNEDIASVASVESHLLQFGLECKPAERVADGARVLGLYVWGERGELHWKRNNAFGEIADVLTRRSVFSFCGKLIGHLPVCGWLRVATAFIKRRANSLTSTWDERIHDESLRAMLEDTIRRVTLDDPAKGRWDVAGTEATVWVGGCSSLALGVVVEVDGNVIEDATWLRAEDASHINMAELDAMIKGVNMALEWQMKILHLRTDSLTVFHWISDTLRGKARLRTKASSEMLIRRRVGTCNALLDEYGLTVDVKFVRCTPEMARTPEMAWPT